MPLVEAAGRCEFIVSGWVRARHSAPLASGAAVGDGFWSSLEAPRVKRSAAAATATSFGRSRSRGGVFTLTSFGGTEGHAEASSARIRLRASGERRARSGAARRRPLRFCSRTSPFMRFPHRLRLASSLARRHPRTRVWHGATSDSAALIPLPCKRAASGTGQAFHVAVRQGPVGRTQGGRTAWPQPWPGSLGARGFRRESVPRQCARGWRESRRPRRIRMSPRGRIRSMFRRASRSLFLGDAEQPGSQPRSGRRS